MLVKGATAHSFDIHVMYNLGSLNVTTEHYLGILSLSIVRSLNLVMYFGCQLDEPYGFPGDHQPDATMLYCTY